MEEVHEELDETRERSESSRSFSSWVGLSLGRFGVAFLKGRISVVQIKDLVGMWIFEWLPQVKQQM